MARFYGQVGYNLPAENVDGVVKVNVVERDHYGDILRATRVVSPSDKVNDDIQLGHQVSIVADAFALENFSYLKYVMLDGARWSVTEVEIQRPRLILSVGGVYNGPIPTEGT